MDAFEADLAAPFGMVRAGGGALRILLNTLTAPVSGTYTFAAWGAGGAWLGSSSNSNQQQASGGFAMRTLFMRAGQSIIASTASGVTTYTFPDGQKTITLTAVQTGNSSTPSTAGTAMGGDAALNGSPGGQNGLGSGGGPAGGQVGTPGPPYGGAGAPGILPFFGGGGGVAGGALNGSANGVTPGGGAAASSISAQPSTGGAAQTILMQIT